MRQPCYMPDQDQLIKDLHGGGAELDDVAPGAVNISVDEYLNPQDTHHGQPSPTDDDLLSSVSTSPSAQFHIQLGIGGLYRHGSNLWGVRGYAHPLLFGVGILYPHFLGVRQKK